MTIRLAAGSFLLVSAAVAWLTLTLPLAARALQLSIAASMAYVAWLAWRGARAMRRALLEARSSAAEPTGDARSLPFVSLVVPARNEAAVIGPTVRSLLDLAYAGEGGVPRFQVVVIDDGSDDGTGDLAREAAKGRGNVLVRPREARLGPATKGAVLAFAMPYTRGDVIGVVDADTRVDPSFLEHAMRAWRRDAGAAAIQVARAPRNAGDSWLTAAQADEQIMDMTSQCGRWATDGTAELRGNGMFVRRDALEALGGWNARALTEDLDLSTRLSASGRHVALAPEATVAEEAVERIGPLWQQRMRWAEGSLRRLLQHGPGLLAGCLTAASKLDFLAFSAEFLVPPLFVTTIVGSLLTIPLPRAADWTVPVSLFAGYGLGIFILAVAGLSVTGVRGPALVGRSARGTLFLLHWLVVVPAALVRIAFWPERAGFAQTPRSHRQPQ